MARQEDTDLIKLILEEAVHAEALEIERRLIERIEQAEATINGLVAAYGILGRLPRKNTDSDVAGGTTAAGPSDLVDTGDGQSTPQ